MTTHLEKVNAAVRSHIDGHEITQQDYDEFLQVVEEGHEKLRQNWLLKWPQFERELAEWIQTVQNYYYRFDVLSGIATYKKLVPDVCQRDMRRLYFGLWLTEMAVALAFATDDTVDGTAERLNAPTACRKIGFGSAVCIGNYVTLALGEIMDEVFASETYLTELRKLHRRHCQAMVYATIINVPAKTRQDWRMRYGLCWPYFSDRVKLAGFFPMWYPIKLAYLLAGKPINSAAGATVWKLVEIIGETAVVADDVGDWEEDLSDRIINWTAIKAMEVDKELIEDYYVNRAEGRQAEIKRLYRQINFGKLFKEYEMKQREKFYQLLRDAPEELPKVAWKTLYEFVGSYWMNLWHLDQQDPK